MIFKYVLDMFRYVRYRYFEQFLPVHIKRVDTLSVRDICKKLSVTLRRITVYSCTSVAVHATSIGLPAAYLSFINADWASLRPHAQRPRVITEKIYT